MITSRDKKIHYSSAFSEWETPQDFFDQLNEEFHFTLDVCASDHNKKCDNYFDEAADGLKMKWEGVCWMNPPYGRGVDRWMKKAYEESLVRGTTTVCLVHARTDTKWFHDYAMKGELRFIKGRLKFHNPNSNNKHSAPFPSLVVVFRPQLT